MPAQAIFDGKKTFGDFVRLGLRTQAWYKVGTKGRYIDIAIAFYEDVPTNLNDERYKEKMAKVNAILEKLTSAEGGV